MSTATEIKLEKADVAKSISVYCLLGKAYERAKGDFTYRDRLAITGKNYADSQEILKGINAGEKIITYIK